MARCGSDRSFFRRQLVALVGRVREIEGPADLKITLDAQKVEQIITKGRQANATPAAVAQQIVRSATVLEKRETRILRALLDDDGRGMFNYQTDYYRPALMALVSKGLVQRHDKGFALTPACDQLLSLRRREEVRDRPDVVG